ncbi:MAG: VWA domain-containing protein [Actinomycetota bacterium]|nr:VWA domain-containing protein [Actinomycetota bacterium]
MKANIKLDHNLVAVEGEHVVHAMFELDVPAPKKAKKRPPLHLALVIDRSGSMGGPKLEHTKAAADYLMRRLDPTDQVAIVTYDDEVDLVSSLAPVDKDELRHRIYGIYPGGMTNLSGGWLKGVEEVGRAPDGTARKVLLLTDGLANSGITDSDTLTGMATKIAGDGVGTTTIGYGDGFNEELLTALADAGAGKSYFAASPEDAPGIFAKEFEDLASLVAQNVSIEIRATEDVKLLGILNEYPTTGVVGGVQVNLGDAYTEENRRVVFELHIPEMAKLGVKKVAEVVLRYVTVGDQVATHELTLPIVVNAVSADEANAAVPNPDVIEEVVILKAARAQKEARNRADHGEYDEAQKLLRNSAQNLRSIAANSKRAEELLSEAEILESHSNMAAPGSYDAMSSKAMHYDQHRKQRARRRPSQEPKDES